MAIITAQEKGRKLASLDSIRCRSALFPWRTYSIELYENWVELGPDGRNGMPVCGVPRYVLG